jgi:hypothetical protein
MRRPTVVRKRCASRGARGGGGLLRACRGQVPRDAVSGSETILLKQQ